MKVLLLLTFTAITCAKDPQTCETSICSDGYHCVMEKPRCNKPDCLGYPLVPMCKINEPNANVVQHRGWNGRWNDRPNNNNGGAADAAVCTYCPQCCRATTTTTEAPVYVPVPVYYPGPSSNNYNPPQRDHCYQQICPDDYFCTVATDGMPYCYPTDGSYRRKFNRRPSPPKNTMRQKE